MDIMSAGDISMSFDDDQLTVVLPDTELTNGLDLATQSTMNANANSHQPTPAISHSTSPLNVTPSNSLNTIPPAPRPHCPSTRFKVQPTSTAQSMTYNHNIAAPASAVSQIDISTTANVNHDQPSLPQLSAQNDSEFDSSYGTKKKVSFPDGQALIKGFAHAPNPWYNVSLCTTDNLVSAYVNSCNAHSVRPLPKLISQLNCIRDFGERINLLTLKGENLNCKHIETLEEIFRRVQFITVDMESTHLDDESAIALFEMVEYYESVIHLKISYNRNLGIRAWVSAARMIRKTQHLESIDVRGCSLNEQCIAALGRALRMGAYIHAIYMQECSLSCRGVMIISAALRTIPTIKELHIGDNNLQPSDGIQLGNLIRNNTYLHTLDIRNNHLQDVGISHICDGLAEQPNGIGLKSLNISNNHFSPASMNVIAIALSRTKSLNTLTVSYNNITNEGFFVLKEGLLKNKSLCRLSLRATKISDEGAVALAEYIADSYTISYLDLRDNEIKTAGLIAVSMCLRVHQTITRLEIDSNVKKEQGVKDYQSQQRFFLDEIQSQVTQNVEIQRAKLDRLLVQSQSEKTGLKNSSISEGSASPSFVATNTTNTVTTKQATNTTPPATSTSLPVAAEQAKGSYFDPLGAVTMAGDGNTADTSTEFADVKPTENLESAQIPDESARSVTIRRGDSIEAVSSAATGVLTIPVMGVNALSIQTIDSKTGETPSLDTNTDQSAKNIVTDDNAYSGAVETSTDICNIDSSSDNEPTRVDINDSTVVTDDKTVTSDDSAVGTGDSTVTTDSCEVTTGDDSITNDDVTASTNDSTATTDDYRVTNDSSTAINEDLPTVTGDSAVAMDNSTVVADDLTAAIDNSAKPLSAISTNSKTKSSSVVSDDLNVKSEPKVSQEHSAAQSEGLLDLEAESSSIPSVLPEISTPNMGPGAIIDTKVAAFDTPATNSNIMSPMEPIDAMSKITTESNISNDKPDRGLDDVVDIEGVVSDALIENTEMNIPDNTPDAEAVSAGDDGREPVNELDELSNNESCEASESADLGNNAGTPGETRTEQSPPVSAELVHTEEANSSPAQDEVIDSTSSSAQLRDDGGDNLASDIQTTEGGDAKESDTQTIDVSVITERDCDSGVQTKDYQPSGTFTGSESELPSPMMAEFSFQSEYSEDQLLVEYNAESESLENKSAGSKAKSKAAVSCTKDTVKSESTEN